MGIFHRTHYQSLNNNLTPQKQKKKKKSYKIISPTQISQTTPAAEFYLLFLFENLNKTSFIHLVNYRSPPPTSLLNQLLVDIINKQKKQKKGNEKNPNQKNPQQIN